MGLNWQTSNRTFERHAQYAEFDEFLEYVQSSRGGYWSYWSHEVTLHKVLGGDARTTDIDEQEFLQSDREPMPEAYGDEWR